MTSQPPPHVASSSLAHAVAALSVAAIVLLGTTPVAVPAVGPGQERGVQELATLWGAPLPSVDLIELNVRSWPRFPPAGAAGTMLAAALAACPMADRPEAQRLDLARRIYAITNGRDVSDAQLSGILDAFQRAAAASHCATLPAIGLLEAVRDLARRDPRPRSDWW